MAINTNREKWVNDVMNSIDGIQRVPATPHMYENVMQRINELKTLKSYTTPILFKRIAVAAILLFVINLASIIHLSNKQNAKQPALYQAVNEELNSLSEDSY